jgi:hypothetical protein
LTLFGASNSLSALTRSNPEQPRWTGVLASPQISIFRFAVSGRPLNTREEDYE